MPTNAAACHGELQEPQGLASRDATTLDAWDRPAHWHSEQDLAARLSLGSRTTAPAWKKGSEKVLGRVLGKGSHKGACSIGFAV